MPSHAYPNKKEDFRLITDMCSQPGQNADLRSFKLADNVKEELRDVSPYLVKFSISLLQMFKNDPRLVAERGIQIIRYSIWELSIRLIFSIQTAVSSAESIRCLPFASAAASQLRR